MWTPLQYKIKYLYPPIKFFLLHGIGATIPSGREIQCLPYAKFFVVVIPNLVSLLAVMKMSQTFICFLFSVKWSKTTSLKVTS